MSDRGPDGFGTISARADHCEDRPFCGRHRKKAADLRMRESVHRIRNGRKAVRRTGGARAQCSADIGTGQARISPMPVRGMSMLGDSAVMPGNRHTSVRSRQVAAELRRHRERAGLSCTAAGARLGVSGSKISRIETGASGVQLDDVTALLRLYEVGERERAALAELARNAGRSAWWQRPAAAPARWRDFLDYEGKAVRMHSFEPLLIPGLLQTAEYARAVISGMEPGRSEDELDDLIATRMARQIILSRSRAPLFHSVLEESALRRPIGGPGVMKRQLLHLLVMMESDHVCLRIVPRSVGAYPGLQGAFLLLEYDGEPDIVYVENHHASAFLDSERTVGSYRGVLRDIVRAALAPDAAADLIREVLKDY
ncbi:helix-turn-helix domain-containing protein [Saccharopolyspora sp. NFXS83]|uniref:helix-turn-helix domain-containing protein n=1 Tax=Saccharopolyspora sp. NFXS83 TaxID=2993560 RepID=UPI00224ABF98|nr:helix-turn-helix transcriptional regulator [Saccharopolyspora sp. NFXS83]